ncbi:MAG: helix-turn-helix domain-containing protein [Desulfovibrionaceae bacterium]|jgi:excisionase family DNA binding protein|nr:helix-turn-helix domain-containing protein [Desulfovibrionaceae bacterium]
MQEKTTYTLAEAAGLLSCHKETIRRAIKAGELRAAKLGKEYRVSKADLEHYWRNRGGGALFDDSPMPPDIRPPEPEKKKSGGPEQLKLPT